MARTLSYPEQMEILKLGADLAKAAMTAQPALLGTGLGQQAGKHVAALVHEIAEGLRSELSNAD